MKASSLFSLFLLMSLLAACAPPSLEMAATAIPSETPAPTPVITRTPLPTTTPKPTPTPEPTPLDAPTAEISPSLCPQFVEAEVSSAGALDVVYATGDAYQLAYPLGLGEPPRLLGFYFAGDADHTGLWLWSEDTQAAVPFPLPPDALGPKLSADHRWIVFSRYIGELQSELWVTDAQGQNEGKLATVLFDEIKARDPGISSAVLNYGWVQSTDKVYYLVDQTGGVGGQPPHDAFVLVDLDSGKAISMAKPLEAYNVVFAPDGRQAAVLTDSELRLVNTQDGGVHFTLPISLRSFGPGGSSSPAYSPDAQYVIGFTDEGIVRINAADGQWQVIPLKYKPISASGDSPNYWSPRITWVDSSTIFLPVTDYEPSGDAFEIDVFDLLAHPDATFTVWRVDLAAGGTAQPVQTFTGFPPSVVFSRDGKRLAFYQLEGEDQLAKPRKLLLADLNTGNILETLESGGFIAWSPDSNRYLYTRGEYPDIELYLGQIGGAPIRLGDVVEPMGSPHWVDAERFLITMGFCEIRLISVGALAEVTLIP